MLDFAADQIVVESLICLRTLTTVHLQHLSFLQEGAPASSITKFYPELGVKLDVVYFSLKAAFDSLLHSL